MIGITGHTCLGLPAVLLLGAALLCPALAEPEPEPEASPDADAHHYGGHHYRGHGAGGYGGYGGGYYYGKRDAEPEADPEAYHHYHKRPSKGYGYSHGYRYYKRSPEPDADAEISNAESIDKRSADPEADPEAFHHHHHHHHQGYGSPYGGSRGYYKRDAEAESFHHHGYHHHHKGYGGNYEVAYRGKYDYGKRDAEPDAEPEPFHHHGHHFKSHGGYGQPHHSNYGYGKRDAEAEADSGYYKRDAEADPEAFHHHGHHSKGYGGGYRRNYGYDKRSAEPEPDADADPDAFHHYGHHSKGYGGGYVNRHNVPRYGSSYGYGKRDAEAEPEAFHPHLYGHHAKIGFGVQKGFGFRLHKGLGLQKGYGSPYGGFKKGYGSQYGGYYKRSAEADAEPFHHHGFGGHGHHQPRWHGFGHKSGSFSKKKLHHHHRRGAEDPGSDLECREVTEEVCEGVCMEKKCETTMVNSCKTVTKTGECQVRWEEKCNDLPHEVQTGVTVKEITKTVCKPGRQTTVCPPLSLTSCSTESSVSECWTPDTFDSDCRGTLCCFNGCADVCLPPTERSCHEVTETVEEPKTEIVMKPVCVPVPIEDCTQQVEECESIPVEKCSEVAISNNDQVLQERPTECPPPSLESCDPATSIANCWSPGSEDVDCAENGLCCYNGCANVCLEDTLPICPKGENKMVCQMMTRVVCDDAEGGEQEVGEDGY